MARITAAQKTAQVRALTNARAALKGAGASEMAGTARKGHTASTKAAHRARTAGIRIRKIRLRKIRIRV